MIKILEIILLSLPIFNNVSYHNSHLLITQLMFGRATGIINYSGKQLELRNYPKQINWRNYTVVT